MFLSAMCILLMLSTVALISAVSRADMAAATGMSYLFRYTGQVTGVAMSSAVMQSMLSSQLKKRITGPNAAEVSFFRLLSFPDLTDLKYS